MAEETIYNTHIQIKRSDGENIYPVIDLGYYRNRGLLHGEGIEDASIPAEKLNGPITVEKGGTGASTLSEARTNLDVYSKSEIADLISGLAGLSCIIVETLPEASAETLNKIYLIAHEHDEKDIYDEYLTIKSNDSYSWEKIGNTDIDLTDYSKKSHKHEFSGDNVSISVTGSYSKATGVTLDPITPAGSISLSRASDVTLTTDTINSIDNIGSLPSLSSAETGDISYLKDISLNNTLGVSYEDPTFTSVNIKSVADVGSASDLIINETTEEGDAFISGLVKENYIPEGNISSSFVGTESKIKTTLTPTGSVDLGPTEIADGVKYVESVSGIDVSGISADGFITGINGGSGELISSTTENEGDIPYLSSLTLEDTYNDGLLTLKVVPSQSYLHHTHNAASASSTASALTSVSGGSVTSTIKYFHPTFSGTESSSETSYMPSGTINSTFTGVSKSLVTDGAVKYIHFAKGNVPTVEMVNVLNGKSASGNVSLTGNIDISKTSEYLNFNAGSLPSVQEKTVATGISRQPTFTGIFNGTPITPTGKLTSETVDITSTGNITPSGKITSAIEE